MESFQLIKSEELGCSWNYWIKDHSLVNWHSWGRVLMRCSPDIDLW